MRFRDFGEGGWVYTLTLPLLRNGPHPLPPRPEVASCVTQKPPLAAAKRSEKGSESFISARSSEAALVLGVGKRHKRLE